MGSKILLVLVLLLTILSVSATYYKTVILQDFDITGFWIEFYEGDTSYVYFVYENEEYEIEPETTDYNLILLSVSEELGIPATDLDQSFLEGLQAAYEEAEYVEPSDDEASEEAEETSLDTDLELQATDEVGASEAAANTEISDSELEIENTI